MQDKALDPQALSEWAPHKYINSSSYWRRGLNNGQPKFANYTTYVFFSFQKFAGFSSFQELRSSLLFA